MENWNSGQGHEQLIPELASGITTELNDQSMADVLSLDDTLGINYTSWLDDFLVGALKSHPSQRFTQDSQGQR